MNHTETYDSAYLDFEFWDLQGGRYDVENIDDLDLHNVGACIFVVDGQVSCLNIQNDSWLDLIYMLSSLSGVPRRYNRPSAQVRSTVYRNVPNHISSYEQLQLEWLRVSSVSTP